MQIICRSPSLETDVLGALHTSLFAQSARSHTLCDVQLHTHLQFSLRSVFQVYNPALRFAAFPLQSVPNCLWVDKNSTKNVFIKYIVINYHQKLDEICEVELLQLSIEVEIVQMSTLINSMFCVRRLFLSLIWEKGFLLENDYPWWDQRVQTYWL